MTSKFSIVLVCILLIIAGIFSGMMVNEIINGYDPDKYMELAQYKGLTVTRESVDVTEKEVNEKIDEYLSTFSTETEVTDGAKDGDRINIDYTTVVDGVAQEDIKNSGLDYTIGKNYFLDGFDEKMIGSKTGDVLKFTLKFPDDYSQQEYASKDIEFTVKINSVTRVVVPELTDEYAKKIAGVSTVAELKDHVETQLVEKQRKTAEFNMRYDLWDKVIDGTIVSDYPAKELRRCKQNYSKPYEEEAAAAGYTDFEKYLMDTFSTSKANYDDYIKSSAEMMLKQEMIEKAIMSREKLKLTDEYISERKAYYADLLSDDITKYTPENVYTAKQLGSEENLMTMIELDLILDSIQQYAIIS